MADDFDFVSSKIEGERQFLQDVSLEIWKNPELRFEERFAHDLLTNALEKCGFEVEKRYMLDTAFRAEFASQNGGGPTIAILLEYDALPEIGHACGHNLIAEAGLAAAIAVRAAMERDSSIAGKVVALGTPAEESGAGKVKLLEKGAFEDIDAALMVHPAKSTSIFPPSLCIIRGTVEFLGKEAHAAAYPWEGVNALDAAVACYSSLSLLRQQIKPMERIHVIITDGGSATNVIPGRAEMKISLRTPTVGDLKILKSKVEHCINGAAMSTGCTVNIYFDESEAYENIISNKVLGTLFKENFQRAGVDCTEDVSFKMNVGSSDMGNVSHVVPAIHPFFAIPTEAVNHSRAFTEAAGALASQEPTLAAAKAMAVTALAAMRDPSMMKRVKEQFAADLSGGL